MDRRLFLTETLKFGALTPLFLSVPGWAEALSDDDDWMDLVHPEYRAIIRPMMAAIGSEPITLATLPQNRAFAKQRVQSPLVDVPWEKRMISVGSGNPDVAIHIINAKPGAARPAMLHMHGGGFISGNAEAAIPELQALCSTLDIAAVTVEYRLAPETTWQGSVEDNYAALKWLHGNAEALGVDPARIGVMGESAGGGHAALLAIAARDRGEVPLIFQCLNYPMLDDRTGSSRPVPDHVGKIIWTPASNRFGWESFLGMEPGGATVPTQAVPARVDDLSGLPPAWIGVGSLDLFVDENVDYAQRLNAAAVPTELIVVPGLFHGFETLPLETRIAKWFKASRLEAIRAGLGVTAEAGAATG